MTAFSFPARKLMDYASLMKPRLISLVILSALVGYSMAVPHHGSAPSFLRILIGTALSAGGSMALNQWMETDRDARMKRTASRPLPAKRLTSGEAFWFGTALSILGVLFLFYTVNRISGILSAATILSYLFFYTPLKPVTVYSMIIGAIPGALPPMIGWAGAAGDLPLKAWVLFAIIFFWQIPHFLAISWMFRDEFAAAEFRMLAVVDSDGNRVARWMVLHALCLWAVSLFPFFLGMTGRLYLTAAFFLGLGFTAVALTCLKRINERARWLFRASLVYLTVLLLGMVADKI